MTHAVLKTADGQTLSAGTLISLHQHKHRLRVVIKGNTPTRRFLRQARLDLAGASFNLKHVRISHDFVVTGEVYGDE